jgi:DNA-binding GntR family transcriptional regulator
MAQARTKDVGERKGPVKGKSNTQQAVSILKDLIVENRLSSGSNHFEIELAEMLGMSRTSVRGATLILEAQGRAEVKPRHGVTAKANPELGSLTPTFKLDQSDDAGHK